MAEMFARDMPPVVTQMDAWACWAAAMESWLRVVPGRKIRTQHDLMGEMEQKHLLTDDGGLKLSKGLPILARKVGMNVAVFPKHKELTFQFLYDKVKSKGHLYLIYHPDGNQGYVAHAHVVWAIGGDWEWVYVMDPYKGKGYRAFDMDDYWSQSKEFVVGWPQWW